MTEPDLNQMRLQLSHTLGLYTKVTRLYQHIFREGRKVVDLCNFACCGRLQGQANQKFNCGWSLQYKSLPTMYLKGLQSHSQWMHQDLADRRCNMQAGTSPLTRVYRLHRQYASTQDSPISTNVPQAKLQGQRRLQRPTQRWEIQPQRQHGRNPAP